MGMFAVNIGDPDIYPPAKFGTVGKLISTLLPNIYILAGLLLFFLLIVGGIGIIAGAGGGDPQKVGQGRKAVTAALIGFLIIFCSYWIIQAVEVITGVDILKSIL